MSQKVSDSDFVVCWVTADTIEDVVKGTGLTRAGCRYRARVLRERGVRLMDLKGISDKEQKVKDLNGLVEKYSRRDKNGEIRLPR